MQKISILILLFVIILFHPLKENKNFDISNNSVVNDLDSLKAHVKKNGWNNSDLTSYRFHLLNSTFDFNIEKEEIKKLPASFEKTFLYSLILKKELKFKEMFDSLFSVLDNSPDYLCYYDELSFASVAVNRQSLIQTYFQKNKSFKAEYRYYLLGLLKFNFVFRICKPTVLNQNLF